MMPHLNHSAFSSPAPPRHQLQPEASARGRGQRFPLAASDPIAVEHYAYQLFLQAADESARPARSAKGRACTARSATTEGMHAMAGRPLRADKNSVVRSGSEAETPSVPPALPVPSVSEGSVAEGSEVEGSNVEGSGVEGPVPLVPSNVEGSEVEGRSLREATVQDSSGFTLRVLPEGHGGTCPERNRGSRAEKEVARSASMEGAGGKAGRPLRADKNSVARRATTEGVQGKPFRVPPLSDTRLASQTHWPVPIPLAYQLWLAHLLWLEEVLHTLDCRPGDVTAAEFAGLQALSRARARFLQEHQFCSRCQAANPRFAQRCRRCAQEF